MKKVFYLLFAVSVFACNSDDKPKENHEFLTQMLGRYRLQAIYTDVAIDLSFDGIAKTNLMEEVECFSHYSFGLYFAEFTFNERFNSKEFGLRIVDSNEFIEGQPYNECMDDALLFYDFEPDEEAKEILITYNYPEREALYGILKKVKWVGDIAYFEFEKRLYTSEGWKTVTLYMEYYKDYEDHSVGN